MIKRFSLTAFLAAVISPAFAQQPAAYVNPFIGASTSTQAAGTYHGLGKTFPGADTPFGMVQVSPNTITGGDNGSGYSYEHTSIEGFAFTQMSGIGWYGDLGNFLVMPTTGALKTSAGKPDKPGSGYRSGYKKNSEKASAGYYSVGLDNGVKTEATAAPHSGMLRFTFPENKLSRIQIDLARRVGGTSVLQHIKIRGENSISGWMKCTPDGGGWGNGDGKADYTVYFYAEFSKPLRNYGIWSANIPDGQSRKREAIESDAYQQLISQAKISRGIKESEGKHLGFFTEFATKKNEQVLMKAGISFVSETGAEHNLRAEIGDWKFDAVHDKAVQLWNSALSKIKVEGGTDEERRVFYSALYHTMLDPRMCQDVDGKFRGGDGKIYDRNSYTRRTIFSGWDVFRSQMPLQSIINPSLVNDEINSLVALAGEKKKNYLERWELLNAYSGCMIGNPAVVVIADAWAKGIRNYDQQKTYTLVQNTVSEIGNGEKGYSTGGGGISNTLEYGYTDWCAAQFARLTGHADVAPALEKRAQAYRLIFDTEKGWFRPKDDSGNWMAWQKEGRLAQGYGCVESNPYQQGWFVPHDVAGMTALMGGRDKVVKDLETLFAGAPADMMWNDYYNHANEPVHHVPYLFNRLGAPWLTQKWTRAICAKAYHNSVEGLVGNEDVGQMSAWYVLSAIGLHPVCPGDTRQEITSPVFSKATIALDPQYAKGKTFTVIAENQSPQNIYIQKAELNGKAYNKCYIDFSDITAGGTLTLHMGGTPNENWGTEK